MGNSRMSCTNVLCDIKCSWKHGQVLVQDIFSFRDQKVCYIIDKIIPLDPSLSHFTSLPIFIIIFCNICFPIILIFNNFILLILIYVIFSISFSLPLTLKFEVHMLYVLLILFLMQSLYQY